MTVRVKGNDTKVAVSGLDVRIGPNELAGEFSADISGRRPVLAADLRSKKVDLASLQSGKGTKPAAASPTTSAKRDRVFSNDPIDVSVLNAFDAKIDLAIDELIVRPDAVVRAIALRLDLANGMATLKPLAAGFAGSQLSAESTIDARKSIFDVTTVAKAAEIDLAQAMAFAGSPGMIEGRGDVAIDLKTRGSSIAQLMGGLDGRFRVMSGEGRMKTTVIDGSRRRPNGTGRYADLRQT